MNSEITFKTRTMKKLTLLLVMINMTFTIFAQSPQAFKYQTVVRDNAGEILPNQSLSFQISLLSTLAGGREKKERMKKRNTTKNTIKIKRKKKRKKKKTEP